MSSCKLIMRFDEDEAKAFQDWVTREVLPATRKTGDQLYDKQLLDGMVLSADELVASVIGAEMKEFRPQPKRYSYSKGTNLTSLGYP